MKRLIFLTLLMVLALSYQIELTCKLCSSKSSVWCYSLDGGPFDNYVIQLSECPIASYPIIYEFSCDKDCSGCGIARIQRGYTEHSCTELQSSIINALNYIYGYSKNNTSLTYDWCPNLCLSTLTIFLICLAGVSIIGAIIRYCIRKNKKKPHPQAQRQEQRGAREPLMANYK